MENNSFNREDFNFDDFFPSETPSRAQTEWHKDNAAEEGGDGVISSQQRKPAAEIQWQKQPDNTGDAPGRYVGRHERPSEIFPPIPDWDIPEEKTAPEPEKTPFEAEQKSTGTVAPPRPEIFVAEPRHRVVLTPETEDDEDDEDYSRPRRQGGGGIGTAVLIVLAAVLVIIALVFVLRGGRDTDSAAAVTAAPTAAMQTAEASQPQATAAPTVSPTDTPVPETVSYTITVTAGTGGSVSPNGLVSVKEGEDIAFTVTADDGYTISQLLVDGEMQDPGDVILYDVHENHSVYAVFSLIPEETPEPTAAPTPEPTAEPTPEPETEETETETESTTAAEIESES